MKYNTYRSCQQAELEAWTKTLGSRFPHLSWAQVWGLGLWSFGIVVAQSCGLSSVTVILANMLGRKESNLRQQLKEWYKEGEACRGEGRSSLEVKGCFKSLLRWVISLWQGEEKRIALVMDATTLANRFTVLAISVVYRHGAIPIAWKITVGNAPGEWKPLWLELFKELEGAIEEDWTVLVLADRGLYARWLYRCIVKLKWHPFLRINQGGLFRGQGAAKWRPLAQALSQKGVLRVGKVTCFKKTPLKCTLVGWWEEPYTDPWLIVTDLAPEGVKISWYSLRASIECGFKQFKRGGWQWQQTRMTEPERAERKWLAMAVATLWSLSLGTVAESHLEIAHLEALPFSHIARRTAKALSRPRVVSCFRRGILAALCYLIKGRDLPPLNLLPEAWPDSILPPVLAWQELFDFPLIT